MLHLQTNIFDLILATLGVGFNTMTYSILKVFWKYTEYFNHTTLYVQSGDKSFVAFGNTPRLFASELDIHHMFR